MQKTYKLLIILCSGLICFALLAKQPAPDQRPKRSKPVQKERHQRTQRPPQAIGVILTFHKWPSEKEQRQISEVLNQDGLTLSKKFKSFKALVFSWPKLKTKNKAQKICRKLSQLKNLNYCEPDALLRPNAPADSKTEAGSPVSACTSDCDNQTISPQNLLSDIQSLPKTRASCKLASSKYRLQDGKLTDYWAQEMVGADLLREEIEKAPPLPEDKHLVSVFDTPSGNHNIHVQNIISHEGPQAVLPALNSSQLKYFETKWGSDYLNIAEDLSPPKGNTQNMKPAVKENTQNEESSGIFSSLINDSLNFFQTTWDSDDIDTAEDASSPKENTQNTEPSENSPLENTQNTEPDGNFPSFINNSMTWGGWTAYHVMSEICPPSILVKASGNNYPHTPSVAPRERAASKDFDAIIVGSLSTEGVVSYFSSEGEEVHILSPSDNYITSVDNNGKYAQFGGTSGAAPLVTGSLAGFEWLSGYHPTAKEAKLLLERTAVPTIHSEFEEPQKNGRGMLNAYKLGRVAKRLKDKCNNDHQCFTQEIQNPENYQFSTHQSVLDDVQIAFPQCADSAENAQETTDCTFKKSAFKKLRQAVLLDTTNVELWRQLQCIYDQEGFTINASAVGTTLLALSNLHDPHSPSFRRVTSELIRGIERIGGEGEKEILQILAQNPSENVRKTAVQGAVRRGGDEGLALLQTLAADTHASVRIAVARGAGKIGGDEGLQLLQTLAADKDAKVRAEAAKEVRKIGGDEGLRMLQTLATDTNASVRGAAIWGIVEIGGTERSQILQPLMTNNNANIRRSTVWAAVQIGGDEGLRMLQTFAADTNASVREEAAQAAGDIGPGKLQILQTLAVDKNASVREEAARTVTRIEGPGQLQLLQTLVTDKNAKVREIVAYEAGELGGDEGLEILRQLTQDPSQSVREAVIMEAYDMAKYQGRREEGREIMRTLTRDSNKAVRERAVRRLRWTN